MSEGLYEDEIVLIRDVKAGDEQVFKKIYLVVLSKTCKYNQVSIKGK